MSDFPLAGQPVKHPSWCDPTYCTAPATYPAVSERGNHTEHRSAPLGKDGMVFEGDQVYLAQSTSVPWECETFLKIEAVDIAAGGQPRHLSIPLDFTAPLLWAILARADDLYREYPLVMQAEGVKQGGPWRPLAPADPLPEPRVTSSDDVTTEEGRRPAEPAASAVPPLADDSSASDETARTEIVSGRWGDEVLDGFACISCGESFAVGEPSIPAGVVDGGPMVFAHHACIFIRVSTPMLMSLRPVPGAEHEGQEELAAAKREHQAQEAWTADQAEKVIEEWTPGPELAAMVEADRAALPELAAALLNGSTPRWVHSGPCIYCAHGPACVTCDLTQGPHWGIDRSYPGPVCGRCSEECKRREIAADPYYSGDYVTMFGDDE